MQKQMPQIYPQSSQHNLYGECNEKNELPVNCCTYDPPVVCDFTLQASGLYWANGPELVQIHMLAAKL